MSFTVVKLRRGSTLQHQSFVGAEGEVTIDTDKWTAVVHDGATPGGFPLKVEAQEYDRSRYITFRAALAQQGVASLGFSAGENTPVPIPIILSTGVITGAAVFSYQQVQQVQDHFVLPMDWVAPITLEILWRSSETAGSVTWGIETLGVPLGETIDSNAFNPLQYATTNAGIDPMAVVTSVINDLDTTNLAASGECFFRLTRIFTDTLVGDVQLLSIRFIIMVQGK